MNAPLRVLFVEDNEILREALVALLDAEPDLTCVADTDSLDDVESLCREHAADVVVMDLHVNGESAARCLPQWRESLPGVRFLVFSGHSNTELVRRMLAAGASAYVVKSGTPDQLLSSIRACAPASRELTDNR